MSKPYVSETPVSRSAEQLKNYWRMLAKKIFNRTELAMLNNGYFTVADPSWQTVSVYDNRAQSFIERLMIADTPGNTFHVFGNGYMAVAKDNGFLDIYAPDGTFFATRQRCVKCFGELSSYVYLKDGEAYLADITGQKEDFLLGNNADIFCIEQNINGFVAVKRRGSVELYNEKMERITPVQGMDRIVFFDCGSFVVHTTDSKGLHKDYLFNAQLKCLMESTAAVELVNRNFFSIRQRLYDAADGSVINTGERTYTSLNGKPVYTSVGKLLAKDHQLVDENGEVVLGFFPDVWDLKIFAGHFACFYMDDRFLVFDLALSHQETKQAISEVLSEYLETEDIPRLVFEYFKQLIFCLEKIPNPHKKMLNGLLLS